MQIIGTGQAITPSFRNIERYFYDFRRNHVGEIRYPREAIRTGHVTLEASILSSYDAAKFHQLKTVEPSYAKSGGSVRQTPKSLISRAERLVLQ
jgi:hypothetical protein